MLDPMLDPQIATRRRAGSDPNNNTALDLPRLSVSSARYLSTQYSVNPGCRVEGFGRDTCLGSVILDHPPSPFPPSPLVPLPRGSRVQGSPGFAFCNRNCQILPLGVPGAKCPTFQSPPASLVLYTVPILQGSCRKCCQTKLALPLFRLSG